MGQWLRDKRKELMMLAVAVVAVAVFALFTLKPSTTPKASPTTTKYAQTWTTAYGSTSCTDWGGGMNQQQRWVAAADMLTGARQRDGLRNALPPDALVDTFVAGITNSCVIPTMTITDVAVGLYVTEHARFAA